jgi:hypothetical protein
MIRLITILIAASSLTTLLAIGGCATAPAKTTSLSMSDLEATCAEIAAKLRASDFLNGRGPDSPRMVVAINKVENLTSDVIPSSEQWWLMQRVRDSIGIQTLSRERNVRFVIPAKFLREAQRKGTLAEDAALERSPTHEMTATFRTATRTAKLDRTDAYLCEYRITDLSDGTLEWSETFEFKRTAFGRSYD